MSAVTMDHTGVGVVCLWLSAAMCVVHGQSHYVNVALNKTYHQSSKNLSHPSSNAANSDTSGVFPANCIHTGPNNTNPWWEVDLGRTFPVYNMDVWAGDGLQHRANSNISVDGQWCASITSFPTNTRKKEVTCPTIMYGQTVRVTRLNYTGNDPDGYLLNLCEVQIWDCQTGWYGKQCNINCSVGCEDAVCDRQTGHCKECTAGYYGHSCNKKCPPLCVNNTCDQTSGRCAACPDDYRGDTCSECKSGFYGATCNVTCQYQCLDNECIRDSGLCEACPENYQGDTCSECKVGFYGPSCNVLCQYQCLNNECTRDTGLCEDCPENYQGNTCSEDDNTALSHVLRSPTRATRHRTAGNWDSRNVLAPPRCGLLQSSPLEADQLPQQTEDRHQQSPREQRTGQNTTREWTCQNKMSEWTMSQWTCQNRMSEWTMSQWTWLRLRMVSTVMTSLPRPTWLRQTVLTPMIHPPCSITTRGMSTSITLGENTRHFSEVTSQSSHPTVIKRGNQQVDEIREWNLLLESSKCTSSVIDQALSALQTRSHFQDRLSTWLVLTESCLQPRTHTHVYCLIQVTSISITTQFSRVGENSGECGIPYHALRVSHFLDGRVTTRSPFHMSPPGHHSMSPPGHHSTCHH